MEKLWLASYPSGVTHDVNPEQFRSLTHMLEEYLKAYDNVSAARADLP